MIRYYTLILLNWLLLLVIYGVLTMGFLPINLLLVSCNKLHVIALQSHMNVYLKYLGLRPQNICTGTYPIFYRGQEY